MKQGMTSATDPHPRLNAASTYQCVLRRNIHGVHASRRPMTCCQLISMVIDDKQVTKASKPIDSTKPTTRPS